MILVIDNYDSFAHNLARYFRQLGLATNVIRNDQIMATEIASNPPQAIVISPGPCTPNEAGFSLEVVREFSGQIPILGICLGHQVIAQAFGGRIVRCNEPVHGRASLMVHSGDSVLASLPSPVRVARYHSLLVDPKSVPACLRVTGNLVDGTIMALTHVQHLTIGLQFHPESVLTPFGYTVLQDFLRLSGIQSQTHEQRCLVFADQADQ